MEVALLEAISGMGLGSIKDSPFSKNIQEELKKQTAEKISLEAWRWCSLFPIPARSEHTCRVRRILFPLPKDYTSSHIWFTYLFHCLRLLDPSVRRAQIRLPSIFSLKICNTKGSRLQRWSFFHAMRWRCFIFYNDAISIIFWHSLPSPSLRLFFQTIGIDYLAMFV